MRRSRQRELIARVFFEANGHLTAEELAFRVGAIERGVSRSTVRSALRLFVRAGVAERHVFDDGGARFEAVRGDGAHHDHLVCTNCGAITEFHSARIEQLQVTVAARNGFRVTHHKLELYGVCAACAAAGVKPQA